MSHNTSINDDNNEKDNENYLFNDEEKQVLNKSQLKQNKTKSFISNSIHSRVADDTTYLYEKHKTEAIYNLHVPSFWDLFISLVKVSLPICYSMIIMDLRIASLYVFTKSYGLSILESLSSSMGVYVILVFGFAWAFNQGYGFLSAQHAVNKEYEEIARLTYKAFFVNLVIGCIFALFTFFFMGPIFSSLLNNKEVSSYLDLIFKSLSPGIPLHLLQTVFFRYFCAVGTPGILVFSSTFALLFQVLSLFFFVTWLKVVGFGIGISFTLGNFAMFITSFLMFVYKNPHPEVLIPIKFDMICDGLLKYIVFSIGPGLLILLTLLSYQIIPLLSILLGDVIFSTYGILQSILSLSYIFTEALSAGSNILVNYSIGQRNIQKLKKVLMTCTCLITVYVLVISIVLWFWDKSIYSIFTEVTEVHETAHSIKIYFIIVSILVAYHSFILESLTALGEKAFPIYSVLFGRYILIIGFSILFIKTYSLGAKSIFLSIIIGQGLIILANSIYLYITLYAKDIEDIANENDEIN